MRLLLVGTGLIGGSVGLAARERGAATVIGYDRSADRAQRAREVGAVDEVASDPATGCREVDLVVVATPVGQILAAVDAVADALPPGAVLTDVGSTKAPIVRGAEERLGEAGSFVGGHPMAGSEGEGVDAARSDLFEDALWILTPTPSTDADAYRRVNTLVSHLGARTLALDPEEHDRLVALVSHLPYAVSTTLLDLAGEEADDRIFRAAAGSFRDVTRTAGSNPAVWRDILSTNREAVLTALDTFTDRLRAFREALVAGDWDEVAASIDRARHARRRFPLKGEREPARPVGIEVFVPDRAGVLAEITTTLGEGSVNIEDLWMEHTPRGGVVHLVVDGAETAERAAFLLGERDLHAAVLGEGA